MIHLGDITKIKGYEAPVVDCIIGGSPCQDLSVAGKRAGLAGERSGLFMEQIRVIKEMRENDSVNGRSGVDVRPRYGIWENVPGALSSPGKGHAGEDFAAVLEEFIRVAEPEAPSVSVPEKGWPTAGCLYDEMGKFSVAWRIMDSQYWGVPQRRRRICLVADFNGLNAPKIVFGEAEHHGSTERSGRNASVGHPGVQSRPQVQPVAEGVSGNPDSCQQKGQETAGDAGNGIGGAVPYTLKIRGGCAGGGKGALIQEDKSATLSTLQDQTLFQTVTYGICSYHSNSMKSANPHSGIYEADTSRTLDALNCGYPGCNQGGMAVVYGIQGSMVGRTDKNGPQGNVPMVMESVGYEMQAFCKYKDSGIASALKARDYKDATDLVVAGVDCRNATELPEQNITLQSSCNHNLNSGGIVRVKHIVRRLTPLECERLQGFPDNWTLIGEPVEEDVADYAYIFDESKYIAPNPADFGLTDEDLNDYAPVDDEDSIDDEDVYDDNYLEYLDACAKARSKATKRVKVGSHKETNYYYTDSNGKRKKVCDSQRYRALGNSIALPPWKWTLKRLCACYERDATMASLFDGIGGFPLIWEQINGKGSCLWASEIEEFPIAVTKLRFGGNDNA